jgi:poly(glycerol-phosphate) alpha-glucosyltransferase
MVVLEAWAHAKPVIMTPECNIPEGFSTGAALRVETNVESIKEGLAGFWEMSGAQQSAMGARGYGLTAQRYAWPRIAEQTEELYRWLLGGGSKPGCLASS